MTSVESVETCVREFCAKIAKNVPVILLMGSPAPACAEAADGSGTQGAALAEGFLRYGFGVVLMQSHACPQPFASQLPSSPSQWLSALTVQSSRVLVECADAGRQRRMLADVQALQVYTRKGALLQLPFSADDAAAGLHLQLLQAAVLSMYSLLSERSRMLIYVLPGSWAQAKQHQRRPTVIAGSLSLPAQDAEIVAKDSGTDSDVSIAGEDAV